MKVSQPGGHLDQLVRQTRAHHVVLSSQADTKANMLITVSAIVIPLTVRYVSDPVLGPAALTMIGFSVLTICLAAYSVMPKVRPGVRGTHDPTFNPLFFGDFAALSYDEYLRIMEEILADPENAYEAQVREVYVIGQYLAHRKYRFLRWGYTCFVVGLLTAGGLGVATSLLARGG